MYEFSFDYVKRKHGEKVKLWYMDSDSFIVYNEKQMIFLKILQKIINEDLIFQTMN